MTDNRQAYPAINAVYGIDAWGLSRLVDDTTKMFSESTKVNVAAGTIRTLLDLAARTVAAAHVVDVRYVPGDETAVPLTINTWVWRCSCGQTGWDLTVRSATRGGEVHHAVATGGPEPE